MFLHQKKTTKKSRGDRRDTEKENTDLRSPSVPTINSQSSFHHGGRPSSQDRHTPENFSNGIFGIVDHKEVKSSVYLFDERIVPKKHIAPFPEHLKPSSCRPLTYHGAVLGLLESCCVAQGQPIAPAAKTERLVGWRSMR